jgi:hypothetical protein
MREADEPATSEQTATIAGVDGKAHSILCADVAETAIPRYLIEWKDQNGTNHTARAFHGETKMVAGQEFGAVASRHRWRISVAVLGSMFVGLVALCLGILLKRDYDPQ